MPVLLSCAGSGYYEQMLEACLFSNFYSIFPRFFFLGLFLGTVLVCFFDGFFFGRIMMHYAAFPHTSTIQRQKYTLTKMYSTEFLTMKRVIIWIKFHFTCMLLRFVIENSAYFVFDQNHVCTRWTNNEQCMCHFLFKFSINLFNILSIFSPLGSLQLCIFLQINSACQFFLTFCLSWWKFNNCVCPPQMTILCQFDDPETTFFILFARFCWNFFDDTAACDCLCRIDDKKGKCWIC